MKPLLRYTIFVLLCSVWTTLCFILPDFADNPAEGFKGVMTVGIYVAALGVFQFLLIYALALERRVFAILMPTYALLGAVVAFYRYAFHATITPMLIDAALHTNMGTVAAVVSWQLFLFVGINIGIAVTAVVVRNHLSAPARPLIHLIAVATLITLYSFFSPRLHKSLQQRYPLNIIHSAGDYMSVRNEREVERQMPAVKPGAEIDSLSVVVVLGEAMRADHWQLNGYSRPTMPRLSQRSNVVSLPHIYSPYTHTAASLPYILTPADSLHPEKADTHHSFIKCFKQQGYNTAWISNQDFGRTYSAFINEADIYRFPNADKSVFVFSGWYDGDLLAEIDSIREAGFTKQLFVLHCIGSHWYYNNHVPDTMQLFRPVTSNRMITANTDGQIVNSYDNTVLYLDFFLDSLISRFAQERAIVFYLSDHGESLGEDGNYLHAAGAEATRYPGALVWHSDKYAETYPEKIKALHLNRVHRYQTDYLFPSVVSAAGMKTEEGHNYDNDIFNYNIYEN